jgi:hypothetical protein
MRNYDRTVKVVMAVFGLFAGAAPAWADGGKVLPPWVDPYGYSLKDAARVTAVYNTGIQSENPKTPPPPNVPFHVLAGDATVDAGTLLYVPVYVADDSNGAAPGFPKHINDQEACADYLDELVSEDYGVERFIIQVDGDTNVLDDDYIWGTKTMPLLDGTPAGTNYIVSAAFVTPLKKGTHTVGIGGIIGGEPVVFLSYTVTVK